MAEKHVPVAAALVESEAKMRAVLSTAVDGIITIDERGIIDTINEAAQRLFGYRADELIGQNVSMLMPEPYRSEHDTYIRNFLTTGQAHIIGIGREVVGLRKDGQSFPMDLAVSEVRVGERRLFTGIARDLTDRKRMERELIEISDREQRRFGQDLHDGLGQVLTGVGFMISSLEQRLASREAPEAADARQISELVTHAIAQARSMARGLHPVRQVEAGLMTALQELANHIEQVYRIRAEFVCAEPVLIDDSAVATHLYRIAQEAANNAIKHGKARRITISMTRQARDSVGLTIADDGVGIGDAPARKKGMGLQIMKYRAGMVGATVSIGRGAASGTCVSCVFPTSEQMSKRGHDARKT
jgi:PAS domain S-box-containing protein